jgi:hypothetical protein
MSLMSSFSTALGSGLALGGVLALCGSWSRGARAGAVPHLGVGLAPALGVAAALRLAPQGRVPAFAFALVLGGAFGYGAHALQARAAATGRLPFGLDLAAAALGLAVVSLLGVRPFVVGTTVLGGSWPDHTGVAAALPNGAVIAVAAVVAVSVLARLPQAIAPAPVRWTLAGAVAALLGVQAAWGAGVALPTVPPEPVALALAAFAAGALGRTPVRAAAVGMGLGLACAGAELLGIPGALLIAGLALAGLPLFAVASAPEAA